MPSVDVDRLHRGAVDLGVGPHRGDELGDPAGGLLDLGEQRRASTACSPPTPGRAPGRARRRARAAARSHQATSTPAAASGGASGHVPLDAVSARATSDSVLLAVGQGQRVGAGRVGAGTSRRSASRATNCSAVISPWREPAERRPAASSQAVVEGVDRPRRRGGRVVDLVGQPGRQRAERDQRLALPGRRTRCCGRCWKSPLDQVHAEREPVVDELAQRLGGHPQHPARPRPAAGGEVDAVLVPGPEAAGPPPGCVHARRPRSPRGRRGGPGRARRRRSTHQ